MFTSIAHSSGASGRQTTAVQAGNMAGASARAQAGRSFR